MDFILNLIAVCIAALIINIILTALYMSKLCKVFSEKIDIVCDTIVEKIYEHRKQVQKK